MMTLARAAAKALAMARPMPLAAPVTMAILPSRDIDIDRTLVPQTAEKQARRGAKN
jgi:hypothetical protein